MDEFETIATLQSDVEASLLEGRLVSLGIDALFNTYYDSAYDGLFQMQKGWGCVQARHKDAERVIAELEALRAEAVDDTTADA